nr:hypothetical protein [Tanacetum cinerariifolium]
LIRAEKIARVTNPLALVAQQQPIYHPQIHPTHYKQNSSTRSQQAATRNRGKAIVNSPQPIYDQEPSMVDDDDETSKDKEIDKLMALISLSYESQRSGNVAGARETVGSSMVQKYRIQCYNCKEFGHVSRECQKPKRAKDAAYHREKMLLCKQEKAGIQLNTEQADWKDDTDDESDDQELEAHYMYMAKIQEASPDAVDSRPIFDTKPEQKVHNDDHYDVFAIELDMNSDSEQIDQNDEDADLAKERDLLASLIEKLKCEIDESENQGVVGLSRWIKKVEQVFEISKCAEGDKVMLAASTFEGRALTWWNGNMHTLGLVNANRIPWTEFKSMMTTEYCPATEIQRMEEEL